MPNPPSVLLVEDQQLLRLGLRISLERLGCCRIVAEAGDGETAISQVQRLQPEVILMDVGLPGIDGIEATWRIKQEFPRTRIIMFTSRKNPDDVTAALGAGADGYCVKDTDVEQIATAIETVMRGEVWLDPMIADVVVSADDCPGVALSAMEVRILSLIKEGVGNHEIACRLNTSNEKITRIMSNFIQRFSQNSSNNTDVTQQRRDPGSNEWLAVFVTKLQERPIFAEKYSVENLLGAGGIGAVFKAKHLYMDRYVALKLLRPELSEDRLAMRNFQREAVAIGNVQHRNVVSVYDFGISVDRMPFLVMEYVNGTNLADILKNEHRLPPRRLVNLCAQICSGLAEAHAKGIVHCDLKPGNILILGSDPQQTVKLVDFGLAQVMPREATGKAQVTDKFFVSGTPAYMSPEQCAGRQLDERSDIYSLGCILYEASTGVNVFKSENAMDTFAKHFQLIPPAMSSISPGERFPPQLEHCVGKMLAKDPAERPQSMEAVMMLLADA